MFAVRRLATTALNGVRAKHTLPELPYAYEALEPIISRDIMMLHHQKHHATYVNNLNATEEKLSQAVSKCDVSGAIALEPALRFNGGGHLNHTIFWETLSPKCTEASKDLLCAITESFGSFDAMKELLSAAAVGVQGSGWAWLGYDPKIKRLRIAQCANQDPLEATTGLKPLFGIDVWEHAYYLQYKNVRADYVKAIFEVTNWEAISKRYAKAVC